MLRWFQSRRERELEDALRYALAMNKALEHKNEELQQRVDALRASLKIEREARQDAHST